MQQIPLSIGHRGTATFQSFQTGENAAVVEALKGWLERWRAGRGPRGRASPPPVFLWGPTGSGKTHLLTALVAELQAEGGRAHWLLPQGSALDDAAAFERGLDLLVIDEADGLDAVGQQRGFAAFVQAADAGFGVVAAGRRPPVDQVLREDLRTRLGWGEVHPVRPLSETETRAALRREADRRGIFLGDEVMAWLLVRYERDLRSLMALLDRLDTYALSNKRPVTLPLLRRMLEEEARGPRELAGAPNPPPITAP